MVSTWLSFYCCLILYVCFIFHPLTNNKRQQEITFYFPGLTFDCKYGYVKIKKHLLARCGLLTESGIKMAALQQQFSQHSCWIWNDFNLKDTVIPPKRWGAADQVLSQILNINSIYKYSWRFHLSRKSSLCNKLIHAGLQFVFNSAQFINFLVTFFQTEEKSKYELMGSCGQQRILQEAEGERGWHHAVIITCLLWI